LHITNKISRTFGRFARYKFPKPIQITINYLYVKLLKLNMEEFYPSSSYKSLNALFTRELKTPRQIDNSLDNFISPSDSFITECGELDHGTLLQIKAMSEQSNILDVIKQKLIQGSSQTTSEQGRKIISSDIVGLLKQLDQIASQTKYYDKFLLQKDEDSQDKTEKIVFILGERAENVVEARDGIQANSAGLAKSSTHTLSSLKTLANNTDGLSFNDMQNYMATIDMALTDLNQYRTDYGAVQQQVESTMRNLVVQKTSILSAESTIRDANMMDEFARLKQNLITYEAGTFALAQANMTREGTLSILV
jgi:flagellin